MTIQIHTGAKVDAAVNQAIASTINAGREARIAFEAAPVIKPTLEIARSDEFRQLLSDVGDIALAITWGLFAVLSLACYAVNWVVAELPRLAGIRQAVAGVRGVGVESLPFAVPSVPGLPRLEPGAFVAGWLGLFAR